MGIIDRFGSLLGRKDTKAKKKTCSCGCCCGNAAKKEESAPYASQFIGDSPTVKALIEAAAILDGKLEEGSVSAEDARQIFIRLRQIESSDLPDDEKYVAVREMIVSISDI